MQSEVLAAQGFIQRQGGVIMNKLFQYFVTSLFFMILGYCIGVNYIPYEFVAAANTVLAVVMVILLLLTWIIKGRKKRGLPKFSMGWVYLFTFIDGILLYPTLMYYFATLGTVLFLNIIISTLLIFSVLSYIGFKQKKRLIYRAWQSSICCPDYFGYNVYRQSLLTHWLDAHFAKCCRYCNIQCLYLSRHQPIQDCL